MDLKCDDRWKVGITSQSDVYARIKATANPDYFLVKAYRIPLKCDVKKDIEDYIHWRLDGRADGRINHFRTSRESEWFLWDFYSLIETLEYYLKNQLSGLLNREGRNGEYNLLLDDEGGKPFEELIYDEVIWTFEKFYLPLTRYSKNPLIQNYLEHANGKCRMPYYSMGDICSGNLNQSEEESIKAHARAAYEIWYRYKGKHHTPDQCTYMLNHFYEKERAYREKCY